MNGVLAIDKPRGSTSHDVVQKARRALATRAVGHTGTLDPMATGVLVLAVGEATKLVQHLTADDKEYDAEVWLGVATDTLDADGTVVFSADSMPEVTYDAVESALARFRGTFLQKAPAVSAIKHRGKPLYERVRRGEKVEPPEREVTVHRLELVRVDGRHIVLRVCSGKGFYVRSLARDLAEALGTVGHLVFLRRTRSGAYDLSRTVPYERLEAAASGDAESRLHLVRSMDSLEEATRSLPRVQLNERGRSDASHGRRIAREGCADGVIPDATSDQVLALVGPTGELVALGRREGAHVRVTRGIVR